VRPVVGRLARRPRLAWSRVVQLAIDHDTIGRSVEIGLSAQSASAWRS